MRWSRMKRLHPNRGNVGFLGMTVGSHAQQKEEMNATDTRMRTYPSGRLDSCAFPFWRDCDRWQSVWRHLIPEKGISSARDESETLCPLVPGIGLKSIHLTRRHILRRTSDHSRYCPADPPPVSVREGGPPARRSNTTALAPERRGRREELTENASGRAELCAMPNRTLSEMSLLKDDKLKELVLGSKFLSGAWVSRPA